MIKSAGKAQERPTMIRSVMDFAHFKTKKYHRHSIFTYKNILTVLSF